MGSVERVSIILTVNGSGHALVVEPRMTLAEALRGPLGLLGAKIACNRNIPDWPNTAGAQTLLSSQGS